ncbi:aldehyde dehydrogenase family protein [Hydrogenophaga sp. BPS33]|uniref:aldehyde dehydrogenase family protein n=1 Tax=Hydrogenophaga sp. BPS33 TaxID=2651974 RepID=UPI001320175E|nr:aldehyde dehydrogenase family protein [Hydrogenophaga sp. BPS33]QHE86696.1 aldehyde dehydrogenase family protein [Hydrogenophaga sp. BPS33]
MTATRIELLINQRDAPGASYLDVIDPGRTADVVGQVAQANAAQVDEAVQAAHAAFHGWSRTPLSERIALLKTAADLLDAEGPQVAELMALESGMLIGTNKAEVGMAANIVRDNADLATDFLQPYQVEDANSWVSVEKRPMGVIAGIVSWNAPVILTMRKLAPALVCGNTIVIKPSPTAAMGISLLLKKMAALFPPGVINVVHGGAEVGNALTTHPLVRKVSFTGGGKVASSIMRAAAKSMKDVQFELGGNDPAIVLDDADLDDLMPKLVGGIFRRSGQFCFAVKRVYVPEALYDTFFERLCAEVNKFKVGHPLNPQATFGPMNNPAQWQFIQDLIARTRAAGAEVIELGEVLDPASWNDGYYLRPAVVKHADPDLEVVLTEQFGPVIPVVAYRSEDDVIRMANQTELGLGSSVWSRDTTRALAVARQLEAGMTFINQAGTSRLGQKNIPFGGVKQSGIGRESSVVGLAEYVEYHGINVHK